MPYISRKRRHALAGYCSTAYIGEYGLSTACEYFAESFMIYCLNNGEFRNRAPRTCAYIDNVVDSLYNTDYNTAEVYLTPDMFWNEDGYYSYLNICRPESANTTDQPIVEEVIENSDDIIEDAVEETVNDSDADNDVDDTTEIADNDVEIVEPVIDDAA